MTSAVVFAYHNVGVRCLSVLLAQGVQVALVVTHRDRADENIWFDSVEKLALKHGLPVIAPEDANDAAVIEQVRALRPDFLFSFYYRNMLAPELLALPQRGAYNMHGSLLPQYRGRVPVNWAVIMGESETGATLHQMVAKPDAGGIDWTRSAQEVHNLVRGVAPPYPGAFAEIGALRLRILRTRLEPNRRPRTGAPGLYFEAGSYFADCGDGKVLRILELETPGGTLDPATFANEKITFA